jgi:phage-related minor tail protein
MSMTVGTLAGILDLDSKPFDTKLAASGSKMGGLTNIAKKVGDHVGLALTGGAIAVVGGLAQLGNDFNDAFKRIRVASGETGPALDGLNQSFKNLLATRPESMDVVADAIAKVHQKVGLVGKPLEDLSRQFLQLSSITGTDLTANLDSGTSALNAWGVAAENQPTTLDELFRITQATGISFADLTAQLASGQPVMTAAGLGFEESAALIGMLAKNGLSASDVMPSLSKGLAVAAKEGKSAGQLIGETFAKIKDSPNDVTAAGDALAVFGAKAGPKMAELIRSGKLGYDDFMETILTGTDTIGKAATDTTSFGGKWKMMMNSMRVTFEPVATKVFGGLTKFMTFLSTHQPIMIAFAGIIAGLMVAAFVAWTVALFTAGGALAFLISPITLVVLAVAALIFAIYMLVTHWSEVWAAIQAGAGAAAEWIVARWEAFIGFVTGLPGRVGSAASGMWDGIKDAFKSAINWVIDHWNDFSITLPSVDTHIPGVGKVGGWTLDTPNIPRLHSGGVVPGSFGQEVPTILKAGEMVRTAGQEAALQSQLASSGSHTSTFAPVIDMKVYLSGKATQDDAAMLRRAVVAGINKAAIRGQRVDARAVA